MRAAIGVDLGGTKTAVGLVTEGGVVLARASAPTPASNGPGAVLDTVVSLARAVIGGAEVDTIVSGCGVGAAGVIDSELGVVTSATDSLPGWAGTRVRDVLAAELELPVAVVNDVHAHALGEALHGAGAGSGTVLMIAAGTGVGGALVVDGRVHAGRRGVSGHFGHVSSIEADGRPCTCGGAGHLEAVASGPAMCAVYRERSGDPTVTDGREVVRRAEAGDPHGQASVALAGRALGRTIGGLVNALDPDVVIVGGGLAAAGELWWAALRDGVDSERMALLADTPIVGAALGADAAIVGAAALVIQAGGEGLA
ncbi:ROK family protein [Agromyces badenianii]|uniref:ROK family protein n=1 Tax=Agromyces badenianii TaxID=2080742 RepID=UPI000D59DD1A|nr:ROK family protein [Agromyces badenianii]PWC05367.1 glucokinase [Agromyces badenianii]